MRNRRGSGRWSWHRTLAAPGRDVLEPPGKRMRVWVRDEQLQLTRVQEVLAQEGVRCSYMTLLRSVRRAGLECTAAQPVRFAESQSGGGGGDGLWSARSAAEPTNRQASGGPSCREEVRGWAQASRRCCGLTAATNRETDGAPGASTQQRRPGRKVGHRIDHPSLTRSVAKWHSVWNSRAAGEMENAAGVAKGSWTTLRAGKGSGARILDAPPGY
jgi:hypothetical protein